MAASSLFAFVTSQRKLLWKSLYSNQSELYFAFGFLGIIFALLFPISTLFLDLFLTFSLGIALIILVQVLFMEKMSEFTAFPTTLLIVTMMRLSLNVASARLVLSQGHEGVHAAGEVIRAFGALLMGDNYAIGFVVFLILMVINFMVITKGSGRIAEVAARFNLDALPGKQMAVDAELASGFLTQEQAKRRRQEIQEETHFYGAMDGASKFVRGDAIAGIVILFLNLVGGLLIGMLQHSMPFSTALKTYAFLTIGDGLVTQIPALLISIAAGLLIARGAGEASPNKAIFGQLTSYPIVLGFTAILMFILAWLPGVPSFPFLLFFALIGYGSLVLHKKQETQTSFQETLAAQKQLATEPPKLWSSPDILSLHHAPDLALLPFPFGQDRLSFQERIDHFRQDLFQKKGVILPGITLRENLGCQPKQVRLLWRDCLLFETKIEWDRWVAMPWKPEVWPKNIEGIPIHNCPLGMASRWVQESEKDAFMGQDFLVMDAMAYLSFCMQRKLQEMLPDLFTLSEWQKRLESLEPMHQKIYADLVPARLSSGACYKVFRLLLEDQLSVRDMAWILEMIQEAMTHTQIPELLAEWIRGRMGLSICQPLLNATQQLPVILVGEAWEKSLQDHLHNEGGIKRLIVSPMVLEQFCQSLQESLMKALQQNMMPSLLTHGDLRRPLRELLKRLFPTLTVLAHHEIPASCQLQVLGKLMVQQK